MALEWFTYEFKTTFNSFGDPPDPNSPQTFPWDTDWVVSLCLPRKYQNPIAVSTLDGAHTWNTTLLKMATAEEAYQMALEGSFHVAVRKACSGIVNSWKSLGDAGGLLQWLVEATRLPDYEDLVTLWPDPLPNPRTFGRPDLYQVYPIQELLRRHVERGVYIVDRDGMMEKHHGRRRVIRVAPIDVTPVNKDVE